MESVAPLNVVGGMAQSAEAATVRRVDRRANEKRANFVSMHAISAATGEGVPELAVDILSTSGGRDVVVCGAVNVGKSTVVRALVEQVLATAGTSSHSAVAMYFGIKRNINRASLVASHGSSKSTT
eukprot:6211149-Pleurochrysis_carterae.AAC.4